MSRIVAAVGIALGVHLLLAAALALILDLAPAGVTTAPELDLSSVELSLSDKDVEAPPLAQPDLPATAPSEPPPETPVSPPAPLPLPPLVAVPPEMAAVRLPAPEPDPEPPATLDLPESPIPDPPERESSDPPTAAVVPAPATVAPPPAPAPDQAKVEVAPSLQSGFDLKKIYPRESRLRGEEGDVLLEFTITERGTVSAVTIARSSGFPALDAAALKAAKTARFAPARSGDRAVGSVARMTLTFSLTAQGR